MAAHLSVPASERLGADGLLGDSAAAGQLHPIRRRHDQLAAPAPACNAVRAANGRVKDFGFKLGVP